MKGRVNSCLPSYSVRTTTPMNSWSGMAGGITHMYMRAIYDESIQLSQNKLMYR